MGFVKDGGCEKSLFTLTNVVNYFLKRHSDVFIVTLDASAAFDRVNIYGLLSKLLYSGVSFNIVRMLLSWYTNSQACVRFNQWRNSAVIIGRGGRHSGEAPTILEGIQATISHPAKFGGIIPPVPPGIAPMGLMDTILTMFVSTVG